jgi:drug/metabolite transporter (DMT)-like permease
MNTEERIPVVDPPLAALAEPVPSVAPATSPARAVFMLVFVTSLWGISFPLMKNWQDAAQACPGGAVVSSATVIALRMFLTMPLLMALSPQALRQATLGEHAAGAVIGLAFFAGFILQVIGLAWTTPALSAFLTSLGCLWVPVLAWLVGRVRVSGLTLAGIATGIGGAAILSKLDRGWDIQLGLGEGLTIIASLIFAVQILLLDRFGKRVRPGHLTFSFIGVTGIAAAFLACSEAARGPGIAAWLDWVVGMLRDPHIIVDLALLTVLCTLLAFQWMNAYQPHVSASRAALIYLLEPVFAAVFSVLWGHDAVTLRLLLGGAVILGGNLLVELPGMLRERAKNPV